MSIRGAIKSETDDKSVEIRLGDDLLPNTSYSLLNISGANGNIDFITPENVEGFRVANPNVSLEQNIESIEILDSETILVHYVNPVNATGYGYKLLAESKVTSITKEKYDVPELTLTLEPPLTSNKDYILMIIELQDVDGNYLEFDTGIYDFKTEEITPPALAEPTLEDLAGNTGATLESETNMDMNAAGPETPEEGNIQEVAAQATQTPDTGTETWVLVFATLFINTSIFFARRKKALAV